MSKEYEKALRVISKPPDKRYDHEIHELVPWLRSKAKLFKGLKIDILADIIRNCDYDTKNRDDIIIKQGDIGNCFYIVLNGKVTIYILNKDQIEGEEDDGNFDNIIQYTKDGNLDRVKLGYCVTSLESGTPFGDVALTSGDSIRTASIIADERTDLLVVDRALYNRSMKEVLAKEFQEKTTFIKNNPLFSNWPPKYRKQLAMALYKESYAYESALTRQGDRTADMYFVLSGQVEIQMDPSLHPRQYPHIFKAARENEVDKLIKKVEKPRQRSERNSNNNNNNNHQHFNNSNNIKRRDGVKCTRLCHLGVNESVGDVELTMDLPTYMQTAVCKETTEVLVLENKHYERLFIRRHPKTIESMRDQIGVKIASRLSMLTTKQEIPFLDYLKKIIESRHKPPPQSDKDKDEHTVSTAEKEFLNHKGPLIDQHGPGSVFFYIKLREKTKLRVQAKRGERIERPMQFHSQRNILMANQMNSLQDSSAAAMYGRPVTDRSQAKSYRSIQEAVEAVDTVQPKEEAEEEVEAPEVSAEYSDDQESGEGQSPLSTWSQEYENAAEQDLRLSMLENRLRQWLAVDNPRGKPQVTQLRRLAIENMEYQPRPGNKVVIRRKDRRGTAANTASLSAQSSTDSAIPDARRSKIQEESKMAAYKILLGN